MRAAAAVVAAALLGGCGAADEPAGTPEAAAPATLRVEHAVETGGPVYVEGAVYHVTVSQDGRLLTDREIQSPDPVSFELPPGGYTLGSYAQVCNGSCESLAPPSDRCEARLEVEAGASRTARIVAKPGGCRIGLD